MFGIGFFELMLILVLCMVFFKPSEVISFIQNIFFQTQKIKEEFEVLKSDILTLETKEKEVKSESKEVEKEF